MSPQRQGLGPPRHEGDVLPEPLLDVAAKKRTDLDGLVLGPSRLDLKKIGSLTSTPKNVPRTSEVKLKEVG